MSEWIKEISKEELPEPYSEMAELIGVDNTIKLALHFSKQGVYFKSLEEIIAKKKKEYIIKNFNGRNHKELARITGFSEQYVYEILRNKKSIINSPTLFNF